jgi:hypothetical protein
MDLLQDERLQSRDEVDIKTKGFTSEGFADIVDGYFKSKRIRVSNYT